MNQFLYPYLNAAGLIHNLSSGDAEAKKLLGSLTGKELRILNKNRDLLGRIAEIARMNGLKLWHEMHKRFGLEITTTGSGHEDCWIDLGEDVASNLPKEFKEWYESTGHTGWYLAGHEEFLEWARDALLQEVRTNLLIRYIEHKRTLKKNEASPREQSPGYGLYL